MVKKHLLPVVILVAALASFAHAENRIRNGSLELPFQIGSTRMLQGEEGNQIHYGVDHRPSFTRWQPTGAEAWWTDGTHPGPEHVALVEDPKEAHSGAHVLKLAATDAPIAIVNGFGQVLGPGTYTFSAWVRTSGATGTAQFFTAKSQSRYLMGFMNATVRKDVALPAESGWTRLSATLEVPKADVPQMAVVRLAVERGIAWMDDIQIEEGTEATPFNVRRRETVRVRPVSGPALPFFIEGRENVFPVRVTCDSREPLGGTLALRVARCTLESGNVVWERRVDGWRFGESFDVDIDLSALRPDAYVVTTSLRAGDDVLLDGARFVDPKAYIGGSISMAMIQAPCAARFAVTPATPPEKLFGSSNRMLSTSGSYWGGYPLKDFLEARRIGYVGGNDVPHSWTDDSLYLNAAGGLKIDTHSGTPLSGIRNVPPEAQNPAAPRLADLTTETGYRMMIDLAHEWGRQLLARPVIARLNLYGEQPLMQNKRLCPSKSADRDFRGWVRERHRTLDAVSGNWGRTVTAWEDITQIVSADMVDGELKKKRREGAEAIAWTAVADTLSAQQEKLLREDPGRGMDWLRWRYDWTTKAYIGFARAFREVNQYTVLDSGFCWPNFWPQMTMKFYRAVGAVGLDVEYCAGQHPGLGTPQEMIDILEMAESCVETPDRSGPRAPMWGHEVYIQPTFADDYAALQTWGLVAHGMSVVGQFAWKPYSDHGPVREKEAWKKKDAHPMWFLIDVDGTRLPSYFSVVRATREMNAFHRRYDGLSLRRTRTDAALFVSADSAVRSHFMTGGKWWSSPVPQSRATLTYLLRLEGVTADYLDDDTLPRYAKDYGVIFVPFSPSLSQRDAALLMQFARDGGTLVLAGASGLGDPWLNAYDTVGGPAWSELGWKAPAFEIDPAIAIRPADADPGVRYDGFKGAKCGEVPGGEVLMLNAGGEPVAWEKRVGAGRVLAFGPYPYSYAQSPHVPAGLRAFAGRLVAWAGIQSKARWVTGIAPTPDATYGEGAPIVEVVRRDKSPKEFFLFVMNTGGKGRGTLEVAVDGADWRVVDALSRVPVEEARRKGATITMPLLLRPWQYRILHFAH